MLIVLGRLDAVDDDVLAAESLDAFLGLVGSAFSDSKHGDDRADPEDDAEHGETGAELVEEETFNPKLDGVEEVRGDHDGGALPGEGLTTSRSMRPSFM